MKYLIDTHVCFWAVFEKEKLSPTCRSILENTDVEVLVSAISLWEIAIKHSLGKFAEFNSTLPEFMEAISQAGFKILPLKNEHLVTYFNYPYFIDTHKDPFDRLLLVTAETEDAAFITKDEKFDAYKGRLEIVW